MIDPNLSPLSADDERFINQEQELQSDAFRFKKTLDPEQQVAFDEIFGPIGQVMLEKEYEETGRKNVIEFGLFPLNKDITPIQNSILALIHADSEERHALHAQPGDSHTRDRHLKEAARLRLLAQRVRHAPYF